MAITNAVSRGLRASRDSGRRDVGEESNLRRVLMVGPHPDLPGGMSTVARVLVATSNSGGRFRVTMIDSGGGGNRGLRGYLRFPAAMAHAARDPFDLLHLHVAEAGSTLRKAILALLATLRRRPYVIHLHGAEYEAFLDSCPSVVSALVRVFYRHAASVVVLGDNWRDLLVDRLGLDPDEITVVRNGVEGVASLADVDKAGDRYVIFLGEVSKRKGVDVLVEAVGQLHGGAEPWRFVLVGPVSEQPIMDLLETAPSSVESVGSKSGLEKDELLARASIFVLPSRAEGLPMAILEGMSAGLPCVVTDVGSIAQVIEDGRNGRVVQAGDVDSLGEALGDLMQHPQTRIRLGEAARADWERTFSAQAMTANMESVWDACLPTSR